MSCPSCMQESCECELSTGYPQDIHSPEGEPLEDLLDVPPFFGDDIPEMAPEANARVYPEARVEAPGRRTDLELASPGQVMTKREVVLPGSAEMFEAILIAAVRNDVITSGAEGRPSDGVHAPNSQHYRELAIDVRWARDREAQQRRYANAGYVTVAEKTHLHVQRYRAS